MDSQTKQVYDNIIKALKAQGFSLSNNYQTGDGATFIVNHHGKSYRVYLSNKQGLEPIIEESEIDRC